MYFVSCQAHIQSCYMSASELSGREGKWEASYTEPFQLPLTTRGFCQVEPSSFKLASSSLHSSSLLFQLGGLLLLLTPPPPLVTNTTALSMSNPLETAWGSQYGANRFSAFTVELLRQGKQTQLKLSWTAQNNCNNSF